MEISIKGEKRGLLWGLNAIDAFCTSVDLELEPALNLLFKNTDGDPHAGMKQTINLAKFTACAINSFERVNRTGKGEVNYPEVLAAFDSEGQPLVVSIMDDFLASKISGASVSTFLGINVIDADDKKKENDEPSA